MQILRFFISALFFIPCTAMEYSTADSLTLTIKDLDQTNSLYSEDTQTDKLLSLHIPIAELKSFAKIQDYVDYVKESTKSNETELFKQTLLLDLNHLPSFDHNQNSESRFNYLRKFFNLTHALHSLKQPHCLLLNKNSLEICLDEFTNRDFLKMMIDLDFLSCNKNLLRYLAHFFFDNDFHPEILSNEKNNNQITLFKKIFKQNALSLGDFTDPKMLPMMGIRTYSGINKLKIIDQTFDVSNNHLKHCNIAKIVKNIKNVKTFFFKNNEIQSITKEDLNALSAIEDHLLDLSNCPITDFPVDHLYLINSINIRLNNIDEKLKEEIRQTLITIKYLNTKTPQEILSILDPDGNGNADAKRKCDALVSNRPNHFIDVGPIQFLMDTYNNN